MRLNSDESTLGKKCMRAFTIVYRYLTVPIILAVFAFGFYTANEEAIAKARQTIKKSSTETFSIEIAQEIKDTRKWVLMLVLTGFALFAAERVGKHKLRKLGDQVEWLVEEFLHNLYHSLTDIRQGLRELLGGKGELKTTGNKINAICKSEIANLSEYMQLATGFKHYTPGSATDVNLTAAAWGVVKNTRETAHGLQIDCESPEIDVVVKAHLDLVATILDELVGNAVKYTDSGSVSVRIEDLAKNVAITVSDTGLGIDKREHQDVFDLFYRSPSVKDRPGNGLGLATVKEIVEEHYHGRLSLMSTLGKGTTITVTLPKATG